MEDGDLMQGDVEKVKARIIDNQLQMGALGGPYIAREGVYQSKLNANGTVTVTLTGTPAVRGVLAGGYVNVNGTVEWAIPGQGLYKLYLRSGPDLYQEPGNVIPIVSLSEIVRDDHLYLADLDLSNPTLPSLDITPAQKPILANLTRILSSPVNPFGEELQQDHLTVGGWFEVILDANETALFRSKANSFQPAITVDHLGLGPTIRSTTEMKLADVRFPDGVSLSDPVNSKLPDRAVSIIDAITRASKNTAVTDLSSPGSGLEEVGDNVLTDASKGNTFAFIVVSDKVLANPTNGTDGQRVLWRIKQDSVGGRIITFGSKFRFGTTVPFTPLSTTANTTDYIEACYNKDSDTWDVIRFVKGF